MSEEDFLACRSVPRNRELMRIFKDFDLVDQLGSGMQRILKVYDKYSYAITPNFLVVTFMFSKPVNELANDVINDVINQNEKLILTLIKEN